MLEAICGQMITTPLGRLLLSHDTAVMYRAWTLAATPLLYYPFNDGTAADASGNARHGTLVAAPTVVAPTLWLPDGSNRALQLNGTSQVINSGWVPGAALAGAFTLEAWIKLAGTANGQAAIYCIDTGAQKGVALWATNSGSLFQVSTVSGGSQTFLGATPANTGAHHLAATWDGTTLSLYLDGALNASQSGGVNYAANTAVALGVGGTVASGTFLNGVIDEAAVYGSALSAAMVADRYAIGTAARTARAFLTDAPERSVNGRRNIDPYPRDDGALIGDEYDDEAVWVGTGTLSASTLGALQIAAQDIRGKLNSLRRVDGTLRWAPSGFPVLQSTVRRHERPDVGKGRALRKGVQISLVSGDPRVYSADQQTVAASPSANAGLTSPFTSPFVQTGTGSEQPVTNDGDADSPPILRVYGAAASPVIYNLTTGEKISLPGLTIVTGQYVEIDTMLRTVKVNGIANVYSYYDSPNSTMWRLTPGVNYVRVTAVPGSTDGATRLDVLYRDAWNP